jgi:pimeloyl-ACP methyl ester carboxylesterase
MPITNIRGVDINYEILGERGPFIALQPGGRRAGAALRSLAGKIAEAGYRVVIYDRRNCGASGIAIEGESENEEWAEDLHELLARLDALPAYIGGSSSGCRLALILALRRPEDIRGLLLWRVTGGAYAAERLTNQYYSSHIEAAEKGGMAAVCAMEHWSEVIATNPKARPS